MAGRYLLAMLAGAFGIAIALAALTWFVDPLAIHGSPRIEGFNALKPALKGRARIFKTVNAVQGRWPCLIVGTSRAETGLDARHEYFRATPCFNAALGGQPYEESLRLVQAAAAKGGLRRVVALLDFGVANAHYEPPADFVADNYRPWRPAALAFNLEMVGQALMTPLRQDEVALRDDQALWLADGQFVYPPPSKGHRALALASEAGYFEKNYFRGPGLEFSLETAASHPLRHVRDLVAFAHANGIELVIVIAPAHARQWETIADAGLWDEWEEWKRRLVSINEEEAAKARKPSFALWDFADYGDIASEPFPQAGDTRSRMRWYFESSHFTPAAGDLLLDRIAGKEPSGFGVRLEPPMLEPHLSAIRDARRAWRERYPADAAEVERIARAAASVRDARRHRIVH